MLETSKNPIAPINLLYSWKMTTLAATEALTLHLNYEFSEVRHLASPRSFQPYPSKYYFAVNLALQLAAKTRTGSRTTWARVTFRCAKVQETECLSWRCEVRISPVWQGEVIQSSARCWAPASQAPHRVSGRSGLPGSWFPHTKPTWKRGEKQSTVKVCMLNSRIKSTNILFSVCFKFSSPLKTKKYFGCVGKFSIFPCIINLL